MIGRNLQKKKRRCLLKFKHFKTQVKEQNERISNLSRLIVHLVKIQGKDLPPEVVLSIIAPNARGKLNDNRKIYSQNIKLATLVYL